MNNAWSSNNSITARPPIEAIASLKSKFSPSDSRYYSGHAGLMQNELLAALPAFDLAYLKPHLEYIQLPAGTQLFEQGSKVSHAYFPTTAVIVLLYVFDDGRMTEISVTGREGVMGLPALMGDRALGSASVQSAGHAYRLKASILQEAGTHCGKLQDLLMRYAHALVATMALNAVCEHHSTIDQKLSRWLLDRVDRLPTNELNATQEMIANFLGVRRESVTEAAGRLRHAGLIRFTRGSIAVVDRAGLELTAGECYRLAKQELDLVLPADNSAPHDAFAA